MLERAAPGRSGRDERTVAEVRLMAPASPSPLTSHEQHALYRLWLAFGSTAEFENPRLGYRRLFSEVLGTFLLVLAAAGGGLLHAKGEISLRPPSSRPG